jgi:hypothetical protein
MVELFVLFSTLALIFGGIWFASSALLRHHENRHRPEHG